MADLRTIAQTGTNPETGEYLSAEERKKLFTKGRMGSKIDPSAFFGKPNAIVKRIEPPEIDEGLPGALVKQDEGNKEVEDEFQSIKYTFVKVLKTKTEKERLREKYYDLLGKQKKTPPPPEDGGGDGPGIDLGRKARNKAAGFFGGVLGALGDLLAFAALDWISKPENKGTVEMFVKGLQLTFKFFNWFIGGTIDNILGGLGMFVGGDSLLERFFGFFKLAIGIFGLRYLSLKGPIRLFNDLKFVLKNIGKFKDLFKGLFTLNGKLIKTALNGLFKSAGSIFRASITRTINRFLIKLFGKAFAKGAGAFAKAGLKSAVGLVRRFPIIGPLIGLGVELALGEPIDSAVVRTIGGTFGAIAGAALVGAGTLGLGAFLGGAAGGFLGEWIAGLLYDGAKSLFGGGKKESSPQMSVGGIADGPEEGYNVVMHGKEVVIPIGQLEDVLTAPFAQFGSSIMGGTFATINSMGSAGQFVKPLATSMLASQMREYGVDTITYQSDVGEKGGDPESITRQIEKKKEERTLDDVFGKDTLKNIGMLAMIMGGQIFGGDAKAAPSGDIPPGGDPGADPSLPAGDPTDGAPVTGGGSDFWTLVAVASREDGDPQGRADVAQSIYNRLASGAYSGKNIRSLILGTWQFEPTWRYPKGATKGNGNPNPEWFNITDAKSAAAATGMSEGAMKSVASQLLNPSLQKNAKEFVQGRTDFTGYAKGSARKSEIQRKTGDNYFGWDWNYKGNKVGSVPSFGAQIAGASETPSPASLAQTPPASPPPGAAPSPPPASFATKPSATSSVSQMSNVFAIDKTLQSRQSNVASQIFLNNSVQQNTRMDINNMPLNSTSISSTQVLNRL